MTETGSSAKARLWQKLAVAGLVSLLLAALGFGFGYQAIRANQQKSLLGWVDRPGSMRGPGGLRAGESTLLELRERFGNGHASLKPDAAPAALAVEYSRLLLGDDAVQLRVLFETTPEQLASLLLQSARDTGAVTGLSDAALSQAGMQQAIIRELQIEPTVPLDHERVLSSYGRPKLTVRLPADETGDTAWLYPRAGLVVIFSQREAIRFRMQVPSLAGAI